MSDAEDEKTRILSRPAGGPAPGSGGLLRCVDTSVLKDAGGAEIRLGAAEVTVGRGAENTVALNAHGISRTHARLLFDDGAWQVEDLGSTNGTRVNNSKVDRQALADGDTVAFGRVCYKFHLLEGEDAADAPQAPDLGVMQQTLVMRPEQRPAPEAPAPKPRVPGAEQIYDSGAHRRPTPAAAPKRHTTILVVIGIILLGAAGAAAAWYLKLF